MYDEYYIIYLIRFKKFIFINVKITWMFLWNVNII